MKPDSFSMRSDLDMDAATPSHGPSQDWLQRLRSNLSEADREISVRLCGRAVRASLSPAAVAAAERLTQPLTVEMELYFSCLVRKAVYFSTAPSTDDLPSGARAPLLGQLQLQFRPVTTAHCRVADVGAKPPVETMPVVKPQAFVPRWVKIDFHRGKWIGEYGY